MSVKSTIVDLARSVLRRVFVPLCGVLILSPVTGVAATICTLVTDETASNVIHKAGDCEGRVTPASTFKVALSLLAFNDGHLKSPAEPALPFQVGYADWGGENWRKTTTPRRWMQYSVVWYSRQLTEMIGAARLKSYLNSVNYGNADFSGDKGKDNALDRAWMTSSLKISPTEQVAFLSNMILKKNPVSDHAIEQTIAITDYVDTRKGWRIWGKTGAAYPRTVSGHFDYARGWGWFVGWAKKGDTTVVFARLIQDTKRVKQSPGIRARSAFIQNFDTLVSGGRE